ncbi:beta strand repeat-containing protein [Devosia sp.]|uniref:beta strand repeat-containing protein n=1 Tax=Devosia sp. TaxID=1871048 RepID=UPI002FC7B45D
MTEIYRHIWSKTLGLVIVVPECSKGGGGRRSKRRKLAVTLAASTMLTAPAWADDLPSGGQIVAGQGAITTNDNAVVINQATDKMIANWQGFSIGAINSVIFNQPASSSVALNRVIGQDPSQILGSLTANGQVFLINPNGIVFGQGASVQTGAFVATTLGMTDGNFLSGNYNFTGSGGSITNRGNITGNVVALIAPSVTNAGTIKGSTALAAGTDVLLDFDGDGLLTIEVKANTLAGLVENKGLIQADGGVAILTAQGASDALKGVVNNSGTVQAQTIAKKNGRILLLGDMDNGEVNVSGGLDASAPSGGNGGFIETSAKRVTVADDVAITTKAVGGVTGTWLIDPQDFTIAASGGDITGATLSSQLASNNVVIESVNGATSGNGDIFVNDSVTWSANALTLSAFRNIEINSALNGSGAAGLALEYGQGAVATGNTAAYAINTHINLASTGSFSTKLGSNGTVKTYTIVSDLIALQNIGAGVSGNYAIGAEIDASDTANWNGGAGFVPIGDSTTWFTGAFDGLGHTITDLTIYRPSTDYVGLFGAALGATIRNVGLAGANITGRDRVGGLVGSTNIKGAVSQSYSSGTVSGANYVGGLVGMNFNSSIDGAYSTATVTGTGSFTGGLVGVSGTNSNITHTYASGIVTGTNRVGGLAGFNNDGSAISLSYATGDVAGTDYVGGLVGLNASSSSISQTYATGAVTGSTSLGGLVGSSSAGFIFNSVWDAETTGQSLGVSAGDASGITSLTTAQALTQASYSGWDFTNDWYVVEGYTRPFLRSEYSTTITGTHQLQLMAMDLTASYSLVNNVDFGSELTDSSRSDMWATSSSAGAGFVSVGQISTSAFTGVFDGLDHTIAGLTINRPSVTIGLFGYALGAVIHDIGLVDASITGNRSVGALVGQTNNSSISRSYMTGTVSGVRYVGGLVGYNAGTTISGSYAMGTVSGSEIYSGGLVGVNLSGSTLTGSYAMVDVSGDGRVGGLAGTNDGTIETSYATGNVTGHDDVGGLAGGNSGTLQGTYATGSVAGNTDVGGLVGVDFAGTVIASFYDEETSGRSDTGKGTGLTTVAMNDPFTFIDAGWDFASVWGTPKASGAPLLRSLAGEALHDYYIRMSGSLARAYGNSVAASGITVDGVGTGNVTLDWGSATTSATNVGTYAWSGSNVLSLSYSAGSAADYYVDYGSAGLTITQRMISLTGSRTYDSTTGLAASIFGLGNLASGETLTLSGIGSMANKNAGDGKAVTLGTLALGDGTGFASNYTLVGGANTVDIAKAAITSIADIYANDKTYDGTTAADLDLTEARFNGRVSGDTLEVASAIGAFADRNAGAGRMVSISGLTLGGADAGNYTLANATAATTADITKAVISAITGITAFSKVYDGTTAAAYNTSGAVFNGIVLGDTLTVASGSSVFADAEPGWNKPITITGLSLGGSDVPNYILADTTAQTSAHIIYGFAAPFLPDQLDRMRQPGFDGPSDALLDPGSVLIEIATTPDTQNDQ